MKRQSSKGIELYFQPLINSTENTSQTFIATKPKDMSFGIWILVFCTGRFYWIDKVRLWQWHIDDCQADTAAIWFSLIGFRWNYSRNFVCFTTQIIIHNKSSESRTCNWCELNVCKSFIGLHTKIIVYESQWLRCWPRNNPMDSNKKTNKQTHHIQKSLTELTLSGSIDPDGSHSKCNQTNEIRYRFNRIADHFKMKRTRERETKMLTPNSESRHF